MARSVAEGEKINLQDLNAILAAVQGDGFVDGGAPTESSPKAMTVEIAAWTVQIAGETKSGTATTQTIGAADTDFPRRDLIYMVSTPTCAVVAGTPDGAVPTGAEGPDCELPLLASLPVNSVVAVEVWVGAGVTEIQTADITDRRVFVSGFIKADKDGDGDYDPFTNASWEDSTVSGTGTIDWNTDFGVPAAAKAVAVVAMIQDSAAGTQFTLQAKSTTTNYSLRSQTVAANEYSRHHGAVPIASGGTSYYAFSAETDNFYLRVVGYWM